MAVLQHTITGPGGPPAVLLSSGCSVGYHMPTASCLK